jgi:leucyl aminopeptidase
MAETRRLGFGPMTAPTGGVLVVFADESLRFGTKTRAILGSGADLVARAAKSERFTGKSGSALDIVAPAGLKASRLIVIGTGKADERKPQDDVKLGGAVQGRIPTAANEATVVLELPGGALKAEAAADVALGATLREGAPDPGGCGRRSGAQGLGRARGRCRWDRACA